MPFVREFIRLCDDGWKQGWHEANGGNLSYRLDPDQTAACMASCGQGFHDDAPWNASPVSDPTLGGTTFLVTGAGRHFRNVAVDPLHNLGLVQVDGAGNAWRIVWGLQGARPTSEFSAHYLDHCTLARRTSASDAEPPEAVRRVVYHAHTPNVIALSLLLEPDARVFTRVLWKAVTECIMAIPRGVGVVGWTLPGSVELARETARLMERFDVVVWAQHGTVCAGTDFDMAFGLMHSMEKAAGIYLRARMANGGSAVFEQPITDAHLRAISDDLGLPVTDEFLGRGSAREQSR